MNIYQEQQFVELKLVLSDSCLGAYHKHLWVLGPVPTIFRRYKIYITIMESCENYRYLHEKNVFFSFTKIITFEINAICCLYVYNF